MVLLLLLAASFPIAARAQDPIAPAVAITSPATGSAVVGTITVTASASDNVAVAGVQFQYNGAILGAEVTSAPYSVSANTTTVPNGSYTLTAVARDAAGNRTTSAPVTVKVSNGNTTLPVAGITFPASGAIVAGTITVTANASDDAGVAGVQFKYNGANLGAEDTTAPYSVIASTGTVPNGLYTLTAVARDTTGNLTTSAPVTVTVANGAAPYTGTPIALPGTFEAENFDRGGEGAAYHDSSKGNAGGQYRTGEDVDIIVSPDSSGGGYVVNNFAAGEWLTYTVNVAAAGQYDIELRASSTYSTSAFHVEINGKNVTGSVTVPNTGSWSTFQWTGKKGITLAAGKHLLRIVADQQYFNLNSIRVTAGSDTQPPSVPTGLTATAVSSSQVNLAWNASTDNVGVKGYYVYLNNVALATTTATSFSHTGLTAGTTYNYRVSAYDAVPNHSAWTAPVSVTTPVPDTQAPSVPTGLVAAAVSASQVNLSWNPSTDNVGVTGYYVYLNDVALATTTTTSFQHTGLTAGATYRYRVSAYDTVPNHSAWTATPVSVTTPGGTPSPGPGDPSNVQFFCTFPNSPADCGFQVQEKVPGRATIVGIGRDGGTAVRLHTEPGDNNVAGSGDMQRNDLYLAKPGTADPLVFNEGEEQWWALSVMFPDDFVFPTWQMYALSGFHHTGSTGQGNFTLGFQRGTLDTDPGTLTFRGYGGTQDSGLFTAPVGSVVKNVWYDFVYHIRWSSGPDGFFDAWVNGVKKLSHRGPTLYAGQGAYFKLANYHTPICDPYPACIGTDPPSSVIYDRVIRGTTALSVSSGPLEGVLTLVNGVLTPLP